MDIQTATVSYGSRQLILETGRMAKQAHGSVLATYGDIMVLATVVSDYSPKAGADFFPLMVDYREKYYAAGKIPGGFFKREGRPTERETLTCRLIDRPIRPLFPKGYQNETIVTINTISADDSGLADVISMCAASAALSISDIPFAGPVGGVRVGRIGGQLIANPTQAQMADSDIQLTVAGTADAIMMVEGGASEVPEAAMIEALAFAHDQIKLGLSAQTELVNKAGQTKRPVPDNSADQVLKARIAGLAKDKMAAAVQVKEKMARAEAVSRVGSETLTALGLEAEQIGHAKELMHDLESDVMRDMVLSKGVRADGRDTRTVRPIAIDVALLPRAHGSVLFTRGETQALVVTTLGTKEDNQRIDALEGNTVRNFMLHYNFPPFSVGEARPGRPPGRREIGHGALAQRALEPLIPPHDKFPYTIRLVSDILESNGSSSMASVCGGSLALMDAGVPMQRPVAGIAMGLIKEGDRSAVLSDILGVEDHLGDMDFKVCGTEKGITALQMDIKITGITRELMGEALEQARQGRMHILEKMNEALARPREALAPHAPRITTIKVPSDKVREVIGSGGKVVRAIVEECGVKIDIEDDGTIHVAATVGTAAEKAINMIRSIVSEPEVGTIYEGTVRKIMDFGAFVEFLPGKDGLVHISQLADHRVAQVTDVVKEGDRIFVKVLEVDRQGKVRLSKREADAERAGGAAEQAGAGRG
ncbi:MAG: polyribonucleotide nucleotidyltransferase [Nitrospirota bacterium]|nr:polyribonucleotide nucleotidyltransferase [Nitrospirota bacterium]